MTTETGSDSISYGDWNVPYGELAETYTEDEARARDVAGLEYWVLVGDPQSPTAVMKVAIRRVQFAVYFLDDLLRTTTTTLFVPEDKESKSDPNGRLFLEQAHWAEYDHQTPPPEDEADRAGGMYFNHDGSFWATQRTERGHEEANEQLPPDQAASYLWEPVPAFGDWASILRFER